MNKAKFVTELTVVDPDTNAPVEIAIYKHENGGMFAIDSSYIKQELEENKEIIPDPFSCYEDVFSDESVKLIEEIEPENNNAEFFLASLSKIKDVIAYVYPDLVNRGLKPTLEERIGTKNGECPECGHQKWWLYPAELFDAYGGKQYIECMNPECGHKTHL